MGSSQSSHESGGSDNDRASVGSTAVTGEESYPNSTARSISHQHPQSPPTRESPAAAGLSGMPLVHHVCRKKKRLYDTCVAKHYQHFVVGTTTSAMGSLHQEDACGDRFDAYRECILKGIKKEIWDKQGLPPPGEGSPLAEVIEDDE